MKAASVPKTFTLSELDAVQYSTVAMKDSAERRLNGQKEEPEQHLYMLWQNKLGHYTSEIAAIQAELESTCTDFGLRMNAHRMRLQDLSRAISSNMGASTLDQEQ
jgi:hypothetical protein